MRTFALKVTVCSLVGGLVALAGGDAAACTGGDVTNSTYEWLVDMGGVHSQAYFPSGALMPLFDGVNGDGQFTGTYTSAGCFTQDTTLTQSTPFEDVGTITIGTNQLIGNLSVGSATGVLNAPTGTPISFTFTATLTFKTTPTNVLGTSCRLSASVTLNDTNTWSGHSTSSYNSNTGSAAILEDNASFTAFSSGACSSNGTALNTALGFSGGSGTVAMWWDLVNISDYAGSGTYPQ
jgi:hypothetical protein